MEQVNILYNDEYNIVYLFKEELKFEFKLF